MPQDRNNKDNERSQSIFPYNVRSNPFGSNISAEKAYKRAERIAAALYMLTKHMSDKEPLKGSARTAGHQLLKDILDLRSGFRLDADAVDTSRLHAHARETISIAQLLAIAGYISRENADMVSRALEELSQFIDVSGTTQLAERITLSREDLLIEQTTRMPSRSHDPISVKGSRLSTGQGVSEKDIKINKGHNSGKDNMSSRREAILDLLKDGKKMGIRDIAAFVVGVSEKTVQRELASLISDGLLKKEGEKRWSRYFII